ncbi:type II toxin-antitoxin system MqsA family antitoxin [Pseudomonas gingeri]|uniref:type II toxin-antitoxin system MqsA family antitoxin n=1 Tax=Pseudomonas gingeri TaxID=117681 RepID=UPI0015A42042|nr:type II toxin-antitoxin system MqsA family antitoxin [Pseudomonas gingeri]NWD68382.1 type II toxin-antitoxin system MqsA family antitoxin [Pseudomonas gingeri]
MKRQDCVSCGASNGMQPFEGRDFEVDFKESRALVPGLSGWQCENCSEIEFDHPSAHRYSQASDHLVYAHRQRVAEEMKRIRRKLHFTQRKAVELLSGGGHNAFSRYERAEIEPPKPLFVLMRLLDRYPELVDDIKKINEQAIV